MADLLGCLRGGSVSATVFVVLGLAACGGPTTVESPTPTMSTAASTTTLSTSAPTTTLQADYASVAAAWERKAVEFRGRIGELVDVECPFGGQIRSTWGSNVYTDDSSICTAAVHVGLITVDQGGEVTIEILDGQEEYYGSDFNGVTSADFGPWPGSFSFPAAAQLDVAPAIGWDRAAAFYRGRDSTEFTVVCEPNGVASSIWGTGTYTADSSICTAAVHADLITVESGGRVTFGLVDGQDSYEGTEANGVTSLPYGSYDASFVFIP